MCFGSRNDVDSADPVDGHDCCCLTVITRLLDIAASPSRSKDVLQAFCDQKCLVNGDKIASATSTGGGGGGASIPLSTPSSTTRSRNQAPLLPHLDCYWIVLGTSIMNRLLVLKENKKKIDRMEHIVSYLAALADAMMTILLHDKPKLEKASQSPPTSGSSRSVLCRAVISTTICSLYVIQKYDPNNHYRDDHQLLETAVETLYRMVYLKRSAYNGASSAGSSSGPGQSSTKDSDVLTLIGSWSMEDLRVDCERVEELLGSSIKLDKASVRCLLESVPWMYGDDIGDCSSPPPAKRAARPRSASNKQRPSRLELSDADAIDKVRQLVSAFEKLLNSKIIENRIDGRIALKRWACIAVVWTQGGRGQLELLKAIHHLAVKCAPTKIIPLSKMSFLMYRLIIIASETGSQGGVRPASVSLDQYIQSISPSINESGSGHSKKLKADLRSDVRDWAILVIYDFLQNHRNCLEEVAQTGSFCDVVNEDEGEMSDHCLGKKFSIPDFEKVISDLCSSTAAGVDSQEERTGWKSAMLSIAVGHVLDLVGNPSLPLDCKLATFALSHISQSIRRMNLNSTTNVVGDPVQDTSSMEGTGGADKVEIQERFALQHELNKPMPKPLIERDWDSLQSQVRCTFAGVFFEGGPFSASKFTDQHTMCIILRALRGYGEGRSPFSRLLLFLIDVIRRVYDTRKPKELLAGEEVDSGRDISTNKRKRSKVTDLGNRKGSRRRKTDQGGIVVRNQEEMHWHKINSARAAVAIEALGCLKACFTRIKAKDFTITQAIRNSASTEDLKCLINLGGMLDALVLKTRFERKPPSTGNDESSFSGCPVEEDFLPFEKHLWSAHMSMAQVLGRGQSSNEPNDGLDSSVWGQTTRHDVYESIASMIKVDTSDGENWCLSLPAASQAFLIADMVGSFPSDTTCAESTLAGAYVTSIVATLKKMQACEIDNSASRDCRLYDDVLLPYNDARTFLLAASALTDEERRSHIQTLANAALSFLQSVEIGDSIRNNLSQWREAFGFLSRVLVVCYSLTSSILSGKELRETFKAAMEKFYPVLPVMAKGVKWYRRERSFLGLFDRWESPLQPHRTGTISSCFPKKMAEDVNFLFETAFSVGFQTAAFDHGHLLFTAWNGLAVLPQTSTANVGDSYPCLDASGLDSAKKILQMREDLCNIYNSFGRGRCVDVETAPISPARLIVTLKLMMIQASDTVDSLLSTYLPGGDDITQIISPASLALMAALPSYMSAIVACYTKAGNDFFPTQIAVSGTRQRGYSSESEHPPSDVDSEVDTDDNCIERSKSALSRLRECCEAFGGAPIHPDWLDMTCSLRDGICHSDIVEVSEMAMKSLLRLANAAFRQYERHQLRSISESIPADFSTDSTARLCLSLLQWARIDRYSLENASGLDMKQEIAMIIHCSGENLNQFLDVPADKDMQEIRKCWCPVSGLRITGYLQDGNRLMDSWGFSPSELRACGEWDLLFAEAITLACLGNRNKKDSLVQCSNVVDSQAWIIIAVAAVNHLVPAAALLRMGIGHTGRKPHPFSLQETKADTRNVFPLRISEPLSGNLLASQSVTTTINDTLSLLATLSAKSNHSIASVCRAAATHLVCDTSSFSVLESICSIDGAFKTLWQIINFVGLSSKRHVKKDALSRVIERLISIIAQNGDIPLQKASPNSKQSGNYTLLYGYLCPSNVNSVETIVNTSVNAFQILKGGASDQTDDVKGWQATAITVLVKLLCDDSLHANCRSRGLCTLMLSRVGTLEARQILDSQLDEPFIRPCLITAFNGIEKKRLKPVIQKDLTGLRGGHSQELANVLSLLLTSEGQLRFDCGRFVMESVLKTFDSWQRISFCSKTSIVSALVTYGAFFGYLSDVGKLLIESSSKKSAQSMEPLLLSLFFGSMLQLQALDADVEDVASSSSVIKETKHLGPHEDAHNDNFQIPKSCTFIQKSGFHGTSLTTREM
jgi:hypothetical protein